MKEIYYKMEVSIKILHNYESNIETVTKIPPKFESSTTFFILMLFKTGKNAITPIRT